MSDSDHQRAHLAEQVGRLSYFVEQLAALDQLRGELPAGYLREELHRLAEQARGYGLVDQSKLGGDVERYRRYAEHWRSEQHRGRP